MTFILIILFFSRVPVVISDRLTDTLWPIGHIVSFACWAWWLLSCNVYIKSESSKRQLLFLLLITLTIGGGIELLQPFFSRRAQLSDLYYDLFGTFFAYLFFGNFNKNNKLLIVSRFLYITLLLYITSPAMLAVKDEYDLRMDFPIIAKFDSYSELTRWKADLPLSMVNTSELSETRVADTNLMKVTFAAKKDSAQYYVFLPAIGKGISRLSFHFLILTKLHLRLGLLSQTKFITNRNPIIMIDLENGY
ncbi:hypothetical protein Ping_0458 [Psychromonas ingrahamii 37]|uniref:Uncharacterized protein n=1 Tax=Psychromonas ingrahamii (strain DSM 17664 / CCUG 51855 / 37) TaxID=357804 RepID=A1SS51_PSYIN|nr:hypothetical protein Ping_0458 [Psychromonas ingrahamii 37]